MFIGKYLSLHSVNLCDKSLVKYSVCLCIIYCVTKAIAVMYSRNIPMAEHRIVCLQSKTFKYVGGYDF